MSDGWKEFIRWIVDVLIVGGVLFVIIDRIRYRGENKSLKKNEVTGSDLDNETKRIDNEAKRIDNETKRLDNDQKQIDIGSLFLEKMQFAADVVETASKRMTESNDRLQLIEDNQKRMEVNQNRMMELFDGMKVEVAAMREDLAEVKEEQSMERKFLNGAYEAQRNRMLEEAKVNALATGRSPIPKPLITKPMTNGGKTKKNPVPRKRGWKPN